MFFRDKTRVFWFSFVWISLLLILLFSDVSYAHGCFPGRSRVWGMEGWDELDTFSHHGEEYLRGDAIGGLLLGFLLGGSSVSSETGWDGHKKDEENDNFRLRCWLHAAKTVKASRCASTSRKGKGLKWKNAIIHIPPYANNESFSTRSPIWVGWSAFRTNESHVFKYKIQSVSWEKYYSLIHSVYHSNNYHVTSQGELLKLVFRLDSHPSESESGCS